MAIMMRSRSMKTCIITFSPFILFCVCFCILSSASSSSASCEGRERGEACTLFQFKQSITNGNRLSSWISSNDSNNTDFFCEWEGISCDDGHDHVVGMNLSGMGLMGSITPSLSNLTHLLFLDLSSNQLSGDIPPQLALCSRLRLLDLSSNHLRAQIPGELGNLKHLEELFLDDNELSGRIPGSLGNCTSLIDLRMRVNNLTGVIPPQLGNLKQLQYLYMGVNQLSGIVPSTLGNCTSLIHLAMREGNLKGVIPKELGNLKKMQKLFMWINSLSGIIPSTLGNCTSLIMFDLSKNNLMGVIPPELGNLKQLQYLVMARNHLSGRIPSALGNCTSLMHLEISKNNLKGAIPPELGNLKTLEKLYLDYNMLSDAIPEKIGEMVKLIGLFLDYNFLEGELPKALLNISRLQILSLAHNHFIGSIPMRITSWPTLSSLDMSYNSFTSSIPSSMGTLQVLNKLLLQHNLLAGTIPSELLKLSSLTQIDLSCNNLSGTIPSSMVKIHSTLSIFNLSHNNFNGSIPKELGYLSELVTLDLSYNNLSGIVPMELNQLKSLVVLNLSHNCFEGHIPSGAPFNNTNITNLEGNPQLCGDVIHRVCPLEIVEKRHIMETLKTKYIIMIVVLFLVVIAIPMAIWCYRLHTRKGCSRKTHVMPFDLLVSPWLHLTEKDLRIATNNFHKNCIIGSGSFSIVYRGVLNYGKEIAVKLLNNEGFRSYKYEAHFRQEVSNLGKLRHRNLIRVLGYCFNMDIKAIIFEYMRKGSLDGILHGALNEVLTWEQRLKIIIGLANGLLYLHHEYHDGAMIHCDIKTSNVLLDDDLEPRICDFGIAQLLDKNLQSKPTSISTLLRGSFGYIPPEYAYTMNPSTSGDVYSFGVLMMEMVTCVRPTMSSSFEKHGYDSLVSWVHGEHDPQNLLDQQLGESIDEILVEQASCLLNISLLCTQEHPKKRPTMREVSTMLHSIGGL